MEYFETWKQIIFHPKDFFKSIKKDTGYKKPILFVLPIILVYNVLLAVLFGLLGWVFLIRTNIFSISLSTFLLYALLFIVLYTLFAILLQFVGAGIYHLFVLMFRGKGGYNKTYNVMMYSMAVIPFMIVPLVNWAAAVYMVVLQVFGISELHDMSMGRAIAVVLIPPLIMIVALIFFYIAVVMYFVSIGLT